MKGAPVADRIEFDLGTHVLGSREFRVRIVLRRSLLAWFVTRAMKSRDGRTVLGSGAMTVLAKRVPAPAAQPSAEGRTA